MKKPIHVLIAAAFAALTLHARAASFAGAVLGYSPGTLPPEDTGYTNASAALGRPAPVVGAGSGFDELLSPFSPHYETTQILGIGVGGLVTLQLENFVLIDRTAGVPEIGIWGNVGVADVTYPGGTTGTPAFFFGANSAVVEVSPDNVNWYSLNNGAPILFTLPGAYYLNAGPHDAAAPATPVEADFGRPFTGTTAGFDGKTNAEILAYFDGSAGGTWLDVDGPGSAVPPEVTQIGFVRVSNPADADGFELDAVSINAVRTGDPVPEPGSLALMFGGVAVCAGRRYRP